MVGAWWHFMRKTSLSSSSVLHSHHFSITSACSSHRRVTGQRVVAAIAAARRREVIQGSGGTSSRRGSSDHRHSASQAACHASATSTPSSFLPEGSGLGLGAGGTYSSDASKLTTEPAIPPPREPPAPARLVLDSPLKPTPPCIGNRIVSEKPLAMSSQ